MYETVYVGEKDSPIISYAVKDEYGTVLGEMINVKSEADKRFQLIESIDKRGSQLILPLRLILSE